MKARHWWITAACALAIPFGAVGTLMQRQFAQDKKTADVGVVLVDKDQTIKLYPSTISKGDVPRHNPLSEPDAGQAPSSDSDGLEFERKLVKSAPFSATLIIETVQAAADGSSLTRTETSLIYRDAKGRTRRDRMPSQSSSSVLNADQQPQITTINDPVAGFSYALEHRVRLFRRTVFQSLPESTSDDSKTKMKTATGDSEPAATSQMLPLPSAWGIGQGLKSGVASSFSETKTEPLGEREIEGVTTEGTRVTVTVLAGAMDNSEPIEIVAERWYSPELKTAILIKRSDPRHGETVYRLTNLKRDEPAATFFVVPNDYKITHEAIKELFPRD